MAATSEFKKFLNTKIRTWKGIDFSGNGSPISMYQMLNVSGVDYKGQVSSGYGEKGIQISVNIDLELLDFLAPGLPGLSLKLGANANAKVTKETLLVLQRFPAKVYSERVSKLKLPVDKPSPKEVWRTGTPITLSTLDGKTAEVEFQLSLTASTSNELPVPDTIDELGMNLSIEASASVSGNIKGKAISLRDPFPASFASPSDTNLALAEDLQATVDKLLGDQSKGDLKKEVDAWIEGMINVWLTSIQTAATTRKPQKAPTAKLKSLLTNSIYPALKEKVETKVRTAVIDELSTKIGGVLDKWVFDKIPFSFNLQVATDLLEKWKKPSATLKTKDLVARISDPQEGLIAQIQNSNATEDDKKAAISQCNIYLNLLQRFNKSLNIENKTTGIAPNLRNKLCYFKLFCFAGGIGADAKAGVSGGIQAEAEKTISGPEIIVNKLPDPNVSLSLQAEANVKVNGEAQILSSRLQSFGFDGGAPLVYTQDNWISYRRVDGGATLFGELGFESSEYQKQKSAETGANLSYYSMSYQSIGRYWLHPAVGAESYLINPASGSGITFGMTVSSQRLIAAAKSSTSASPKILESISRQLRVPLAKVKEFITKANISTIDPAQDGFPENVFLEASFAFPENTKMTLKKKPEKSAKGKADVSYYDPVDGFNDPDIRNFLKTLKNNPGAGSTTTGQAANNNENFLEAIRIRFRIADFDTTIKPLFQLGFPVLKSSLNLDLSIAKGAGLDALFDYYVEWYNNSSFNSAGNNKLAYELSVPPVVLLHQ